MDFISSVFSAVFEVVVWQKKPALWQRLQNHGKVFCLEVLIS